MCNILWNGLVKKQKFEIQSISECSQALAQYIIYIYETHRSSVSWDLVQHIGQDIVQHYTQIPSDPRSVAPGIPALVSNPVIATDSPVPWTNNYFSLPRKLL